MTPIIGISAKEVFDEPGSTGLIGARTTYIESIIAAGGVPLIIPFIADPGKLIEIYKCCHAILLPGGEDVEPVAYGEKPHEKLGAVAPRRDGLEIFLTRRAYADKKPILGICRGIQVMNVALGGTLYQDLPSQHPSPVVHSDHSPDAFRKLTHQIKIESGCFLERILSKNTLGVNSLHHQAIKDIAPTLRVSARAPDEIIEGVEGSDHPFCIGVQCHPETLWQTIEPSWLELFQAFIRATRQSSVA